MEQAALGSANGADQDAENERFKLSMKPNAYS
jgi:hypothetical protein